MCIRDRHRIWDSCGDIRQDHIFVLFFSLSQNLEDKDLALYSLSGAWTKTSWFRGVNLDQTSTRGWGCALDVWSSCPLRKQVTSSNPIERNKNSFISSSPKYSRLFHKYMHCYAVKITIQPEIASLSTMISEPADKKLSTDFGKVTILSWLNSTNIFGIDHSVFDGN